ncbi:hypothetical protein [Mycobacterium sp. Marseille-P9652]|uniref:hypothetical protein n=1 Tax=Mycobacterium sp. Marseille-P9652 TaxID=2654950 RepID=UPI0012E795A4|nr:hypothetical protein [Mycobacterium sp. Marseille-P9652]
MADDELDTLYWAPPDAFTAERAKLAAAAKKRGDAAAAKRISAARKPTTSAWIVNRLALGHKDTAERLGELGDRLRAAHAAMDGDQIRELSAEQHRLIDQLARAAFDAAGVETPSASARDDLTSTLQAAIADPDVRARLGRLARPEQWTGFGAFADAPAEDPAPKPSRGKASARPREDDGAARRRQKLIEAVAAAERAKADAADALASSRTERDAARQRRDDALAALQDAERDLAAAEERYAQAKRDNHTAGEVVKEAKAQLRRA